MVTGTVIDRPQLLARIRAALKRSRVVGLVGPRQSGKTALGALRGLVVIDEVQRRPDLFPILRVLSGRKPVPARFLIPGRASPALLQQSSESLAGRLEMIKLEGFNLAELGADAQDRLWRRGGFPWAYLSRLEDESYRWRQQFIRGFSLIPPLIFATDSSGSFGAGDAL